MAVHRRPGRRFGRRAAGDRLVFVPLSPPQRAAQPVGLQPDPGGGGLDRTVASGVGTVLGYVAWQLIGFGQVSLNALVLGTLTVSAFLGVGYAVASQRLFARQRREDEIRRRVTEERLRIARELHDVVSHSISTINVQAGVAAHVIDERPETAKSALLTIKETSRDTLRELRGILNVLRQFDDVESRQPAPGLAQLDLLVDTAARACVPTTASIEGTARPLPAAVDLAAYRIIQESLTNVIRHAGRASARVTVAYEPDRVVIDVSDNARGAAMQSDSAGWQEGPGLAGMRGPGIRGRWRWTASSAPALNPAADSGSA